MAQINPMSAIPLDVHYHIAIYETSTHFIPSWPATPWTAGRPYQLHVDSDLSRLRHPFGERHLWRSSDLTSESDGTCTGRLMRPPTERDRLLTGVHRDPRRHYHSVGFPGHSLGGDAENAFVH